MWPILKGSNGSSPALQTPINYTHYVMLVHRGSITRRLRVRFAHERALLRVPVIARSGEMVDVRVIVGPNDRV